MKKVKEKVDYFDLRLSLASFMRKSLDLIDLFSNAHGKTSIFASSANFFE
jgi:hypothetical protein